MAGGVDTRPNGIVTLLTDFGLQDPFVGVMKGVVLQHLPGARIVDVTHGISPGDVQQGAFWLEHTHRWFPAGSVHVVVIDPGVGTERRAIVVESGGHLFVLPDNGLAAPLFAERTATAHAIDLDRVGLPTPSRTFHGRDVFAPVGARLAAGSLRPAEVGPRVEPVLTGWLRPVAAVPGATGVVVTVDRFGNLISNLEATAALPKQLVADVSGVRCPLVGTYADARVGQCVVLVGSFGTLEIAVRNGSAAEQLGCGKGTRIALRAS